MKHSLSRRSFLGITGAAGASLTFQGGEQFIHKLIPYVNPPENIKPGEWAFYTTTCRECPAGCGLLLWHRDGRVTKAEGNPLHPINRGKICIRGQASVQGQYLPERLSKVMLKSDDNFSESSWDDAFDGIHRDLSEAGKVVLLSDTQTGSLAGVMKEFAEKYNTTPVYLEAFNYEASRIAADRVFGKPVIPRISIKNTDLVVSFGTPFLETWLSSVEYAVDFGHIHSLKENTIVPLIYLGPAENLTAVNADEHIVIHPGEEAGIMYRIAQKLAQKGVLNPSDVLELSFAEEAKNVLPESILDKLSDLIANAENPVILAGNGQYQGPEAVMAAEIAFVLNKVLTGDKNINHEEFHALSRSNVLQDVFERLDELRENDVVVIHNSNMVYTHPFLTGYLAGKKIIYVGSFMNETARMADWILPTHFFLEEWGDYEPWKGTISLMQPVMKPLYPDTKSAGDIFLLMAGGQQTNYKERVRKNWINWNVENGSVANEETFYAQHLRKGVLSGTSYYLDAPFVSSLSSMQKSSIVLKDNQLRLFISPSLFFYDGRLANRPWLQEIPHPISNISWSGWVDMNASRAKEMKVEEGDAISISNGIHSMTTSVRLSDGIHQDCLVLESGYGHEHATVKGEKGSGNAFLFTGFTEDVNVVTIEKVKADVKPVLVHPTKDQHQRKLLQDTDLNEINRGNYQPDEITWPLPEGYHIDRDLYKPHDHKDHRWAMVIDLQKCIGCKSCEAACYAENNIPVVGPKNTREGREMSWLKIVPYKIHGNKTAFLPTLCQHCDAAPCEPVCPVFAAVHNEEGLNAQIYNRCIGTRYCSNNCPYKVRRFNWSRVEHAYPANVQLNPEVSVRERGVMEKCTFCVQRIRNAQYKARIENRKLEVDEIVPACAQTCPTNAIYFGDLLNKEDKIRTLMEDKRHYQLLHEFNTKPAVVYLKKVNITI